MFQSLNLVTLTLKDCLNSDLRKNADCLPGMETLAAGYAVIAPQSFGYENGHFSHDIKEGKRQERMKLVLKTKGKVIL